MIGSLPVCIQESENKLFCLQNLQKNRDIYWHIDSQSFCNFIADNVTAGIQMFSSFHIKEAFFLYILFFIAWIYAPMYANEACSRCCANFMFMSF